MLDDAVAHEAQVVVRTFSVGSELISTVAPDSTRKRTKERACLRNWKSRRAR
jgi:hypothetical protein